jgi:hypothetical protein
MKLTKETKDILKNFSAINPGIYIRAGNVLSTVTSAKNILADAKITEEFPVSFGIYDLNNFLSVLSMFKDDAELAFDEKHVYIKGYGGRSKVKYRFTDPSMIVIPPEKRPNLPSVDVTFSLSTEDFNWILRSAGVLSSPNIAVESDGSTVSLRTFDSNDDSAHSNSLELENVSSEGKSYSLVFKTEYLKMFPGDYVIEICSRGIAKFTGVSNDLVYFVTLETSSVYN